MFCFTDSYTLHAFLKALPVNRRKQIARLALVTTMPGSQARERSEAAGFSTTERKRLIELFALLANRQRFPALWQLEVGSEYFLETRVLLPLLRTGPKQLRSVKIVATLPLTAALDGTAAVTPRSQEVYPSIARRVMVRGDLPEVVSRAMKGQGLPWWSLDILVQRQLLENGVRGLKWKLLEHEVAKEARKDIDREVLVLSDEEEWTRIFWLVKKMHWAYL